MRTRAKEDSGKANPVGSSQLYRTYFESEAGSRGGRQCHRIKCKLCRNSWFGYVFKPEQRRFVCYWHVRVRHPGMLDTLFPEGEP